MAAPPPPLPPPPTAGRVSTLRREVGRSGAERWWAPGTTPACGSGACNAAAGCPGARGGRRARPVPPAPPRSHAWWAPPGSASPLPGSNMLPNTMSVCWASWGPAVASAPPNPLAISTPAGAPWGSRFKAWAPPLARGAASSNQGGSGAGPAGGGGGGGTKKSCCICACCGPPCCLPRTHARPMLAHVAADALGRGAAAGQASCCRSAQRCASRGIQDYPRCSTATGRIAHLADELCQNIAESLRPASC